jgi:hypothetical protein
MIESKSIKSGLAIYVTYANGESKNVFSANTPRTPGSDAENSH